MRESAIELVRQHVPKPTAQTLRSALEWSLQKMLSFGITSFTEASIGFVAGSDADLDAYVAVAKAGVLKQRTTLCLTWSPGNEDAERVIAMRNVYARYGISPTCVKIFLDGVPTDGHTAAMLEPYQGTVEGRDDEASRRGLLFVNREVLNAAVTRFDRMGLTVKFHAAGDAAVRAGLNAIEAARKANGFSGLMHNPGHCTFVAKDDIARARAIGATFEVSPYLWGPSPINDAITAAVGDELIRRVWPVREMLDAGALVVPGSDWSVVPSVSPWIGVETLVTREIPGGSARSFGKGEAITLAEALDLFTVNAAAQEHMADKVGRIEVGMLAEVFRNSAPRAICQAELCDNYDLKLQELSPRDPEKGLNRMAVDIMRSIFRRMASEGIKLDQGLFETLQFAYIRQAEDTLRAYGADAVMNGLTFPRHEEETAVSTFGRSIREAARNAREMLTRRRRGSRAGGSRRASRRPRPRRR